MEILKKKFEKNSRLADQLNERLSQQENENIGILKSLENNQKINGKMCSELGLAAILFFVC